MNLKRYLVLAATVLCAGSIIHAADAPEAQPRPTAEAKKPAGPGVLTPEQRAMHLPFLPPDAPHLAADDLVHQTLDGTVVIEAEHFTMQQRDQIRRWYLNSEQHTPAARPDGDPVNVDGAGGGAYMEALPDTFVVEGDRAIDGINLGLLPGSVAVLCFKVNFSEPGRYYLWTRMRSDDEEDNTLNAGLNDEWPASAKCLQFQKHTKAWQWGGVIRSPQGPSFPRLPAWLDVPTAGVHTVMYSMREDGCCFDRFILTTNKEFAKPEGVGPVCTPPKAGRLPEPIAVIRTDKPIVQEDVVFEEADGQLVVEAEAFFEQTNTEKRAWHITSASLTPKVGRDIDTPHFADAGGGAYIEVLPDTGNDPVGPVAGESLSDTGGAMAVASYRVHFNNLGRYYIWVRALGTDGDDNTLHFGMDGEWPTNAAKMHHSGGGKWDWACRHRQHRGKLWLDVTKAGSHVIHLSMREDGCEVDRFVLTTNEDFVAPTNRGPAVKLKSGVLPEFSAAPSSANSGDAIVVQAESVSAEGWELATIKAGFGGTNP